MEGIWCLTVYLTDGGKGGRVTAINIINGGGRWGRRKKKGKKEPLAHYCDNRRQAKGSLPI